MIGFAGDIGSAPRMRGTLFVEAIDGKGYLRCQRAYRHFGGLERRKARGPSWAKKGPVPPRMRREAAGRAEAGQGRARKRRYAESHAILCSMIGQSCVVLFARNSAGSLVVVRRIFRDAPRPRAGWISGKFKWASGHALPMIDTVLAATAIAHDLYFVARNVKDVRPLGVVVFDPWNDEAERFPLRPLSGRVR